MMTELHAIGERARHLLAQAGTDLGAWVCVTLPLRGVTLHSLPQTRIRRYLWMRPDRGERWLGLGSAWHGKAGGDDHLQGLAARADTLFEGLVRLDPESVGGAPRLSLCSSEGRGHLNLPLVQLHGDDHGTRITLCRDPRHPEAWMACLASLAEALRQPLDPPPGPPLLSVSGHRPDAGAWIGQAAAAVAALRRGGLRKLVLARRIRVTAQRVLSERHLVQALACRHPGCTIFAADLDDGIWVGASPEVLLDLRAGRLLSEAVAGTVRRDPDQSLDRALGEWLLSDAKNLREHALVVDALGEGLLPACRDLEIPARPELMRLRGLQHLRTPLRGRARAGWRALQMAQRLHPSPAICGAPRHGARDWLRRHERLPRRWFAGLSGWIDPTGDASLNVVLRCARLRGRSADLYAGAGLVADSEPLAEWEETELKLSGMIQALSDA
ncbi:MAG: isochorismate synthase [gamma proteobacterium symbiont of Phacoides pectinatus]